MIRPDHLLEFVIRPTLELMGAKYTGQVAEMLLLGTAAQESRLGEYLHQLGGGPALGVMQIEPRTHADIWNNWIRYHMGECGPWLDELVPHAHNIGFSQAPAHRWLIWCPAYSVAMARLVYWRIPEVLPASFDVESLAYYWKSHYNTEAGAGTVDEFIDNYDEMVRGRV